MIGGEVGDFGVDGFVFFVDIGEVFCIFLVKGFDGFVSGGDYGVGVFGFGDFEVECGWIYGWGVFFYEFE